MMVGRCCLCCKTCACRYVPKTGGPYSVHVTGGMSLPFAESTVESVGVKMSNTLVEETVPSNLSRYGFRNIARVNQTEETVSTAVKWENPIPFDATLQLDWLSTDTPACVRSLVQSYTATDQDVGLSLGSGYVAPTTRTLTLDQLLWVMPVLLDGDTTLFVGSGPDGTGPAGEVRVLSHSATGYGGIGEFAGSHSYCSTSGTIQCADDWDFFGGTPTFETVPRDGSPGGNYLRILNGNITGSDCDLSNCSLARGLSASRTTEFTDGTVSARLSTVRERFRLSHPTTSFERSSWSIVSSSQGTVSGSLGSYTAKLTKGIGNPTTGFVGTGKTAGGALVDIYVGPLFAALGASYDPDLCYLLAISFPGVSLSLGAVSIPLIVTADVTWTRNAWADNFALVGLSGLPWQSSFAGDPFFKWQGQPSPISKWKDPTPFSFDLDEDVSELTGSASTLSAARN